MSTIKIEGQLVAYHWSWMDLNAVHWTFERGTSRTVITKDVLAIIAHTIIEEVPEIVVEQAQVAARIAALEAEKVAAAEAYRRTLADIDGRLCVLHATSETA